MIDETGCAASHVDNGPGSLRDCLADPDPRSDRVRFEPAHLVRRAGGVEILPVSLAHPSMVSGQRVWVMLAAMKRVLNAPED